MRRFLEARPSWDIDAMDIWRETLPEFDGDALEAKYARQSGRVFSSAQCDAFAELERMAMRFALADRVLISTPMWNFGIPYKLKQWFDLIVQPGLTFGFDPARGYFPLLQNRPTIVILASGSDFVTGMNRGRRRSVTGDGAIAVRSLYQLAPLRTGPLVDRHQPGLVVGLVDDLGWQHYFFRQRLPL